NLIVSEKRCLIIVKKEEIEAACNQANVRFIGEALSGYPKYKYLHNWLQSKSFYLNKERCMPNKNYRVYKRGTIVYVDFGVNVGYELSGNHFAIVLNNKDNSKNGVVCVVPISSKKKSNYVSVGKILEVASIKQFISQADKLKEKLRIIILLSLNRGIIDESDLNSFIKDIEAKGEKLSVEEVEKRAVKHNLVCETREQVIKEIKSLSEDMVKYQKVFNCYKKYTQESYVMPLNIQTISKNRIRRINKFDPSGNMKAPGNVLNEVDESLKKYFTK
ncbi:TPA: type II toxin-antitoxin system PemK/MazF family toxin, partial [Enterococcus faecium]